jgi:hypothetical protein
MNVLQFLTDFLHSLKNILQVKVLFTNVSQTLFTNVSQTSYENLMNFIGISHFYRLLCNNLETAVIFYMNFLQISYKLLVLFLWKSCRLLLNILQASFEHLASFFWTSCKLLWKISSLSYTFKGRLKLFLQLFEETKKFHNKKVFNEIKILNLKVLPMDECHKTFFFFRHQRCIKVS